MPHPSRSPVRLLPLLAACLVACSDAPTDPMVDLITDRAGTALDVSEPLPSLDDAAGLSASRFAERLDAFDRWLDAVQPRLAELNDVAAADVVVAELAAARVALGKARAAERVGERASALAHLVLARSHALRTGAAAVADRRIAEASAAAASCDEVADPGTRADRSQSDVNRERGLRLLAHAREALEYGEPERAFQRAHYAAMLLRRVCGR